MAPTVYTLCFLTALACAILLTRGYRRSRFRLLLWSALCFWGLAVGNLLLFADLLIFPGVDLYGLRLATTLTSMLLLVFGLIWEDK